MAVLGVTTAAAGAERAVLDNGLVVLHHHNPSSLTLAVTCFIRVSAMMETRESAGWRHLVQQTILDLPDAAGRRLEERAGEQGIPVQVQTSADYAETLLRGTGDQLPQLLGLVREVLSPARVPVPQVEVRRRQVLRQLEERRQLPQSVAHDLALGYLFAGTPCAWSPLGTAAVGALSPQRLHALRLLHYVPNRAVVTVSGPVAWGPAREAVQQQLGPLLPRPVLPEPALRVVNRQRPSILYSRWAGDNAVILGAATSPGPGHTDFAAVAVLSAVLGSGEGSRLFMTLRDTQGLTYSINTDLAPSGRCGMIQFLVACEPQQAAEVLKNMRAEMAGLDARPPSEAEVHRAAAYLTSSYLLGRQRNADVAHYLGMFETLVPGRGAVMDLTTAFEQVSATQVAAATTWLRDRTVWVQVGGPTP